MAKLHRVVVEFTPLHSTYFAKWHGLFLNALVTNALADEGIMIEHGARKNIYLSPILGPNEKVVMGNVLSENTQYRFSIAVSDEKARDALVRWFVEKGEFEINGVKAVVTSISVTEHEVRIQPTKQGVEAPGHLVTWTVNYGPTLFRFRSRDVLYPSPRMLIMNTAATATQILSGSYIVMRKENTDYVGMISSVDLKNIAAEISMNTEIIDLRNHRVVKLDFGVRNNTIRRVKAFTAEATYLTYVKEQHMPLLQGLIELMNITGVGKNRALALGYVRAEIKNVKRLGKA